MPRPTPIVVPGGLSNKQSTANISGLINTLAGIFGPEGLIQKYENLKQQQEMIKSNEEATRQIMGPEGLNILEQLKPSIASVGDKAPVGASPEGMVAAPEEIGTQQASPMQYLVNTLTRQPGLTQDTAKSPIMQKLAGEAYGRRLEPPRRGTQEPVMYERINPTTKKYETTIFDKHEIDLAILNKGVSEEENKWKPYEKGKEDLQSPIAYTRTVNGKEEIQNFDRRKIDLEELNRGGWKPYVPPQYTFIPTSEGFVPGNVRTGKTGKPTGLEKPLSSEMITAIQQIGTLKDTLNQVRKTYNKDYVGFVSGRVGSLKEATVGVPEKQAAFYADLEQIKNSLIYLLSGKQINETEYDRLLKQLPERNLPSEVFETRMKTFERTVDSIIAEREKASGGYGVPRRTTDTKADPLGLR